MALKIKQPDIKPTDSPDVEIYLEQNADGSVDVVTGFVDNRGPDASYNYFPSSVIRFFDDGSIARVKGLGTGFFHQRDSENKVVID
jgi:hypothetical protein